MEAFFVAVVLVSTFPSEKVRLISQDLTLFSPLAVNRKFNVSLRSVKSKTLTPFAFLFLFFNLKVSLTVQAMSYYTFPNEKEKLKIVSNDILKLYKIHRYLTQNTQFPNANNEIMKSRNVFQ